MRRLLQSIALFSTTWVLVATSRVGPPCSSNTAEKVTFRVEGTCGPPGVVTIDSDSSCGLSVGGAQLVQLPLAGSQITSGPMLTSVITLGGEITTPDGGRPTTSDGGSRSPSVQVSVRRDCRGVPDGGTFELSCTDLDGETCTALLVP
ncbi:MAG: hypothetical protein GQE15_25935 [Archangiaceae bacterium]|nr:hypothetical protein [Archangiaceae bacterium]